MKSPSQEFRQLAMSSDLPIAEIRNSLPAAHPLLFATVSGAHLYGFPSPDSDIDVRGSFVLPVDAFLGLKPAEETVTKTVESGGREVDFVAHDLRKFIALMLKHNGYVLEQLYSPLVLQGGAAFEELRVLGRGCIVRHLVHHYRGFARNQLALVHKQNPPSLKELLYESKRCWLVSTKLLKKAPCPIRRQTLMH